MSDDLHTLSGAYAVDALSGHEAEQFSTHLEQCQVCRDEVRELTAAAAMMGAAEAVPPPPALKARVLAAADRQSQLPPRVTPLERARSRRWTARIVSVAAAVVLLVGGVLVFQQQQDGGSGDRNVATSTASVFAAADARTATVNTDHGALVMATSPGLGRMAVDTKGLRPLGKQRVYQMWAVHSGTSTSVGVLEDLRAGKVMPLPSSGTTVAITIEPAGGSRTPTTRPIMSVDPESV